MRDSLRSRLLRAFAVVAAALLLCAAAQAEPAAFSGETDGDCLYTLLDEQGRTLTRRGGRIYEGDEYISSGDGWYRVVSVDDAARTATARYLGPATRDEAAFAVFAARAEDGAKDDKRLIAMYSTHSDESYVPDDGAASKWKGAGIYDVGDSLKAALEARGIEAVYSKESFLPHDADAYNRSRRTAEALLKKGPDALLDIHRDAVPAEEYETEVDGEDISKVRLFVGRNNQNAAENKAFAQQIKAEADRKYPGLIKDIFIGRGNYNQELYPHALLLEFGTHEIEKEKAQEAAGYIAEVLDDVLYGPGAKAEGARSAGSGAVAKGIGGAIALVAVAAVVYALAATGSLRGAWHKLGRHVSEVTGGLIGKKEDGK
ncbi:MAG: stage II sporulation protein P [Clostridia bacterium]|nr:stage II sporulation protein P [Clostridia bacterium]